MQGSRLLRDDVTRHLHWGLFLIFTASTYHLLSGTNLWQRARTVSNCIGLRTINRHASGRYVCAQTSTVLHRQCCAAPRPRAPTRPQLTAAPRRRASGSRTPTARSARARPPGTRAATAGGHREDLGLCEDREASRSLYRVLCGCMRESYRLFSARRHESVNVGLMIKGKAHCGPRRRHRCPSADPAPHTSTAPTTPASDPHPLPATAPRRPSTAAAPYSGSR